MKTSHAFQWHQHNWKLTLEATSTIRGKIDESTKIELEIQNVVSSRGITFPSKLFLAKCELIRKIGTLRKKTHWATTCNSRISKIFLGRAGISVGKWLSVRKNTSAASVCGVISHRHKLDFSRDLWLSEEDIASFPRTQRSSKTDTGSYVSRTQENLRKYETWAGNWTCFLLPGDHIRTRSLNS